MALHENEICLVCNKPFEKDDDVVVCPVCGTPHHRECYNELGHCVNSDKHKQGYEYVSTKLDSVDTPQPEVQEPVNVNSNATPNTFCKNCGTELNSAAPFCYKCGAKQENYAFSDTPVTPFSFPQVDFSEEIEGKKLIDIVTTVKTNTNRFVDKFRKNKKLSWNWGAFFFGPLYLFYRKMYKEGFFAMLINYIISLYVNGFYSEQISAYTKYSAELMSSYFKSGEMITQEAMDKLNTLSHACMPAMLLLTLTSLVISIVVALFADWFYKKKVFSIIDRIDKSLSEDEDTTRRVIIRADSDMSKSQLKAYYLSKIGGTSLTLPLILVAFSLLF